MSSNGHGSALGTGAGSELSTSSAVPEGLGRACAVLPGASGQFFTQGMVFEMEYLKQKGGCLMDGVFQEGSTWRCYERSEVLGFYGGGL